MSIPLTALAPFTKRGEGPVTRTASGQTTDVKISYEFFPPKSEAMEKRLWNAITALEPLNPDFVSVTYGAGGSTRERTLRTVTRMVEETDFRPAAHLTCVGHTKDEVDTIARDFWEAGVRHIVALRGDSPDGIDAAYTPHPDGYAYGSDLVAGLKRIGDFEISVSAYPERHPESPDWDADIDNLKRKVDAGATRAITQFFFTPDTYSRYLDRVRAAGIDIPIVPGLMLQPNFKGLKRMADMTGVSVPEWYAEIFAELDEDETQRDLLTATLTSELAAELHARGVRDFHLYTLNRSDLAASLSRLLGRRLTAKTAA